MKLHDTFKSMMGHYKEVSTLGNVISLLHWDQRVMMPPKGLIARAQSASLLERLAHEFLTAPQFVEQVGLLAENINELEPDEAACVREIKREMDRSINVPNELVEEISRQTSLANANWVEARERSDFAYFAPSLKKLVALRIEEAQAIGFEDSPYDAMIDAFEPHATRRSIEAIFQDLRDRLVPFLQRVFDKPPKDAGIVIGQNYPVSLQREFGLSVIEKLGFDFQGGRQDISVHPFCTGTMGDVRITTRFDETDPRKALFGMIHEAGHGLYEQGLNPKTADTPLSEAVSLALHESQSRLWENIVGRSLPFWKHFYPTLQKSFSGQLAQVSLGKFYEAINIIEGSLVRVEADEATYQLHVILRFEIENDLVNGRIEVDDLPEIWNRKMLDYLQVKVPNDAMGVLQDVHWSEGLFGYFPTYCLGNLYGAQIFMQAKNEMPDLESRFKAGDFSGLHSWLKDKIYSQGRRYTAKDLVEKITGKQPSAEAFMQYLEEKYGPLYGL